MWLEVKRPGKEPTPLQAQRLEKLNELGFAAGWFDDATKAIAAVQHGLDTVAAFQTSRHSPRAAEIPTVGTAAVHAPGGELPEVAP
jgi:hypothetical protein